jgi:hypothetical protein
MSFFIDEYHPEFGLARLQKAHRSESPNAIAYFCA